MPERNKKFHEFAIKSSLFKGRSDWYFCFLKAEKIAHVLLALREKSALTQGGTLQNLVHNSLTLPQHIAHFAAGEMDLSMVIGDIFGLLSWTRLAATEGALSKEHALIFEQEFEQLAQKLGAGNRLSPFVTSDDFAIPQLPQEEQSLEKQIFLSSGQIEQSTPPVSLKDNKGHYKGQPKTSNGHSPKNDQRAPLILGVVRKNNGISIKGISAVIKDCSEKTIQRDLAGLIREGLVRKQGDRRWSLYFAL